MEQIEIRAEPVLERRVFESWSITIPVAFAETFVIDGAYWHAYDDDRSISLTSVLLSDRRGPVSAARILEQLPPLEGSPVAELPPDLLGHAALNEAEQPARASRAISGFLAADGRVLVVTITSDDLEWARRTWRSIRHHREAPARRREHSTLGRAREPVH
jgi:hypothetical protein